MNGIQERKPSITQISILFSITIFLFIFIGYRAQGGEFYSGVLITEFGLILLPALIYLFYFKYDLKNILRLNGTKPVNFLVVFFLMLSAIPLAGVFNLINLILVNTVFGKVILQQIPAAHNGRELLINILVIAGSAGLCEEFLFRGVIQRGLERIGIARAVLLSAFLFSLTHMDFQKIFGTFLLGALIGFIVHKTNSLYCGMFAHFTNNAAAVFLTYMSTKLTNVLGGKTADIPEVTDIGSLFATFGAMPPEQLILVIFVYGFMLLFIAVIFILLFYGLIRLNPAGKDAIKIASEAVSPEVPVPEKSAPEMKMSRTQSTKAPGKGIAGLLWLTPGLILIAGIYFLEVSRFTGAANGIIEAARRLLGIIS